jgi:hypothetical protein
MIGLSKSPIHTSWERPEPKHQLMAWPNSEGINKKEESIQLKVISKEGFCLSGKIKQ